MSAIFFSQKKWLISLFSQGFAPQKKETNVLHYIVSLPETNPHLTIYGDAVMLFVSVGE